MYTPVLSFIPVFPDVSLTSHAPAALPCRRPQIQITRGPSPALLCAPCFPPYPRAFRPHSYVPPPPCTPMYPLYFPAPCIFTSPCNPIYSTVFLGPTLLSCPTIPPRNTLCSHAPPPPPRYTPCIPMYLSGHFGLPCIPLYSHVPPCALMSPLSFHISPALSSLLCNCMCPVPLCITLYHISLLSQYLSSCTPLFPHVLPHLPLGLPCTMLRYNSL